MPGSAVYNLTYLQQVAITSPISRVFGVDPGVDRLDTPIGLASHGHDDDEKRGVPGYRQALPDTKNTTRKRARYIIIQQCLARMIDPLPPGLQGRAIKQYCNRGEIYSQDMFLFFKIILEYSMTISNPVHSSLLRIH